MPRLQFDVSEQRLKELDRLMEEGGISTRKDLFNNALTLLEWALEESKKGNTIASVNEREGKYRELQMPVLRHAAAVGMGVAAEAAASGRPHAVESW